MSSGEESDPELEIGLNEVPNLMATRQRRSNAGNRLRQLINAEEPLDDEENIFMEFDDDEEFEEGMELELAVENSDEEQEGDEEDDEEQKTTSRKRKASELDDENFSSESSSEEEDQEEEDAGEKELQKQQREEKRKRAEAKKRKMFEIKSLTAPVKKRTERKSTPTRRHVATSADLLNESRRVSKRTAAVKNTREVIERLQESEARRASLPAQQHAKKKVVKKMTQEERLAEAKITEKKNTASLNRYFEMEEARKQRQRAAMLARRKPLVNVVRYVSTTKLVPPRRMFTRPKLVEVIGEKDHEGEEKVKTEDGTAKTEDGAAKAEDGTVKPEVPTEKLEGLVEKAEEANEGPKEPVTEEHNKVAESTEANNGEMTIPLADEKVSEGEKSPEDESKGEGEKPLEDESKGEGEQSLEHQSNDKASANDDDNNNNDATTTNNNTVTINDTTNNAENNKPDENEQDSSFNSAKDEIESTIKLNEELRLSAEVEGDGEQVRNTSSSIEADSEAKENGETNGEDKSQEDDHKEDSTEIKDDHKEGSTEVKDDHKEGSTEIKDENDNKQDLDNDGDVQMNGTEEHEEHEKTGHFDESQIERPGDYAPVIAGRRKRPTKGRHHESSHAHFPGLPDVQGPYAIRQRNTVTLLNFDNDMDYTSIRIRQILFGRQSLTFLQDQQPISITGGRRKSGAATASAGGAAAGKGDKPGERVKPPNPNDPREIHKQVQARTCAVTGKMAKFTDPVTGIKYATKDAFTMIQLVKGGNMTWNSALGGVYRGCVGEKHASGVPPGFALKLD